MNRVYKKFHQKVQIAPSCLKLVVLILVLSKKITKIVKLSKYANVYILKPKETHNYRFL